MSTSKIRTTFVSGWHRPTIGPMVSTGTSRTIVHPASCLVFDAVNYPQTKDLWVFSAKYYKI